MKTKIYEDATRNKCELYPIAGSAEYIDTTYTTWPRNSYRRKLWSGKPNASFEDGELFAIIEHEVWRVERLGFSFNGCYFEAKEPVGWHYDHMGR